jgi:hypothetical protein
MRRERCATASTSRHNSAVTARASSPKRAASAAFSRRPRSASGNSRSTHPPRSATTPAAVSPSGDMPPASHPLRRATGAGERSRPSDIELRRHRARSPPPPLIARRSTEVGIGEPVAAFTATARRRTCLDPESWPSLTLVHREAVESGPAARLLSRARALPLVRGATSRPSVQASAGVAFGRCTSPRARAPG